VKRFIASLFATFGLLLGGVALAAPAQAWHGNPGECGVLTLGCGRVDVRTSSTPSIGIRVTYSWGEPMRTDHFVSKGESSKQYGNDADGVRVHDNYNISCDDAGLETVNFYATGWHKVSNTFNGDCLQYTENPNDRNLVK
jgi:hypothetical protein